MKSTCKVSLLAVCILLTAFPAAGQIVYDNGPINGQVDAWTINFGFAVTESICCRVDSPQDSVTGIAFGAWLVPGDTITSVQVSFGTGPFGSDIFNGVVSLTQSDCSTNGFGFNVCTEVGSFSGPTLTGNSWVTLQNANVPSGDPVYWDENSGVGCMSPGCPSQAQQNTIGTIPSEAFTILGVTGTGTSTTTSTSTGTTPEPGSLLLFGTAALAVIGGLRRKLHL